MNRHSTIAFTLIASIALSGCSTIKEKWDEFTGDIPQIVVTEVFPPVFPVTTPTAKANHKYRLVHIGETLQLDGRMSVNRQNGSLNYIWEIINKPENSQAQLNQPNGDSTQITIDQAGRYDLTLTVTDSLGQSDMFDMTFSTQEADLPQTSFVVLGDAGTGGPLQFQVGKGIANVCEEKGCDFVIATGDNFYPAGVKTVKDSQFQSKFEEPYKDVMVPFYMTLGNHDTTSTLSDGDGIFHPTGNLQIAYTRLSDKPSFRFQLPARYYTIKAPVETPNKQPLVDLYALDTTLITTPKDTLDKYKLHDMFAKESHWLEHQKAISQSEWQIAFGHHTYLSNGQHGNAGNYENADEYNINGIMESETAERIKGKYVKEFLDQHVCNDMDFYFAGHDHNLQYLHSPSSCANTGLIVSGAGGRTKEFKDANRNPIFWQADDLPGFFYVQIIANQMTITAYTMPEGSDIAAARHTRTISK